MTNPTCATPLCEKPGSWQGLCLAHHNQRRAGRPDGLSDLDYFWSRTDRRGLCWVWTGSKVPDGYGKLNYAGTSVSAHRLAYELTYGAIPSGMEIDHQCRNRACINPEHLAAVTRKANAENRVAYANSASGIRGVMWDKRSQSWRVQVTHDGRSHSGGYFLTIEAAEAAVVALRNRLFTNNVQDRQAA